MPTHILRGIGPPYPKQQDIVDEILTPVAPGAPVKKVDLCCGLGFGKTTMLIDIGVRVMWADPRARLLFLQPDWKRVNGIFLKEWMDIVPEELYTINAGKQLITFVTGATARYGPRNITSNTAYARRMYNGLNLTGVLDDETAIGFDYEQYSNILGRIRVKSDYRFYLTASTPIVGPYTRMLKADGHKTFVGRTRDNPYLPPDFEAGLRRAMGVDQARRELDAERIALEGRLWKTAKYQRHNPDDPKDKDFAWPNGNRHDIFTKFDPTKPWYLGCDLGSTNGAYVVIQRTHADYRGRELFPGSVWVAVADLCPRDDASASRAFQILKREFGIPSAVVGGADMGTTSQTDGRTVAYFVTNVFGQVPIYVANEHQVSKRQQYDLLSFLFCSTDNKRRFTVARDYISLEPDTHRGVREMIDEDAFPEESKRRPSDYLPKNREIIVQHTRDALLMLSSEIMAESSYVYKTELAG